MLIGIPVAPTQPKEPSDKAFTKTLASSFFCCEIPFRKYLSRFDANRSSIVIFFLRIIQLILNLLILAMAVASID